MSFLTCHCALAAIIIDISFPKKVFHTQRSPASESLHLYMLNEELEDLSTVLALKPLPMPEPSPCPVFTWIPAPQSSSLLAWHCIRMKLMVLPIFLNQNYQTYEISPSFPCWLFCAQWSLLAGCKIITSLHHQTEHISIWHFSLPFFLNLVQIANKLTGWRGSWRRRSRGSSLP